MIDEMRPVGKLNMHPDMPRPNVPDDYPVHKWNGLDGLDCRGSKRFTFGHIPQAHWEQIFGKKSSESG